MNIDLNRKFHQHGFDVMTMACRAIPYFANNTNDVEPITHINPNVGFDLNGKIMINLECTPADDPAKKNFKKVFTLVSNRFYMAAKVKIEENLVISLRDIQLTLNIDSIQNSTIGEIDVGTYSTLIGLFEPFIVAVARAFLNNVKIPVGFLIANFLGIDWFNFDKTLLTIYDQYFILFSSPKFNFPDDPTEEEIQKMEIIPEWLINSASDILGNN